MIMEPEQPAPLHVWKDREGNYLVAETRELAATIIDNDDPQSLDLIPDDGLLEAYYEHPPAVTPEGRPAVEITEKNEAYYVWVDGWVCEATAAEWAAFNGPGVLFYGDV